MISAYRVYSVFRISFILVGVALVSACDKSEPVSESNAPWGSVATGKPAADINAPVSGDASSRPAADANISASGVAADGELEGVCVYNPDSIEKPEFFSSEEFESAKWDDKNKEAAFHTRRGERLNVTYTACEDIGQHAVLTVDADKKGALSLESISRQVKWLAEKVLRRGYNEAYGDVTEYVDGDEFREHFPGGVYDKTEITVDFSPGQFSSVGLRIRINSDIRKLFVSITTLN
jgi:hypothetical protein